MLDVILSNRFKKDLKAISKRGYNLDLLDDVVNKLARMDPLPAKNLEVSRPDISTAPMNPAACSAEKPIDCNWILLMRSAMCSHLLKNGMKKAPAILVSACN